MDISHPSPPHLTHRVTPGPGNTNTRSRDPLHYTVVTVPVPFLWFGEFGIGDSRSRARLYSFSSVRFRTSVMEHGELTRARADDGHALLWSNLSAFYVNWSSQSWSYNCMRFFQSHGGGGHFWYLDHPQQQRLMMPGLPCATHGHHVIFHQAFLNWTREFHHQGSDYSSEVRGWHYLSGPRLRFPALLRLPVFCPRIPAGLVATASSVSNVPETKQSSLTESVMSDGLRDSDPDTTSAKMMGGEWHGDIC